MTSIFTAKLDHNERPRPSSVVFAFQSGRLVVRALTSRESEPLKLRDLQTAQFVTSVYLGVFGDRECFALNLSSNAVLPSDLKTEDLRDALSRLDEVTSGVVSRALQLVQWRVGHSFCGYCGSPTEPQSNELALRCRSCDQLYFPRIAPAVITMVERDDRILLARNKGFRGDYYSVLAGFVEPGETLEAAVAREVSEEVGIQVDDIRYFGSQSWPFPNQLMVAFTARHTTGEIKIQATELIDANWFAADQLPALPRKGGMGRRLIDCFVAKHVSTRS